MTWWVVGASESTISTELFFASLMEMQWTSAVETSIDRQEWGGIMGLPKDRIATHPGEVLLEEYIKPLGLTQATLAKELDISTNRLNELVRGKRGITADTALRLAHRFRTSPELWMNLQSAYELTAARMAMAD
jgi:addiction module HigA family antidote